MTAFKLCLDKDEKASVIINRCFSIEKSLILCYNYDQDNKMCGCNMKLHKKKMIAPIIISIIIITYYVLFFGFILAVLEGIWKIVFAVIPLVLSLVVLMVCIERIKEIKKGEEDDISKY